MRIEGDSYRSACRAWSDPFFCGRVVGGFQGVGDEGPGAPCGGMGGAGARILGVVAVSAALGGAALACRGHGLAQMGSTVNAIELSVWVFWLSSVGALRAEIAVPITRIGAGSTTPRATAYVLRLFTRC
jgi:hypothetical protein